jgi:mannose-6-phosphate isomerase-like protein (cupin superfamily)
MLNKQSIYDAINQKKIIFIKSAVDSLPTWNDFTEIYNKALALNLVRFQSFASSAVDNSENYGKSLDNLIDLVSSLHDGKKIAALSIFHMLNATDNTVPEEAEEFSRLFFNSNPATVPQEFDFNLLVPARHSDPVDGFYIQCNGTTIWRAFYEDSTDEFFVEPGDVLFIPKGIEHSVESRSVRNAVSISFTDN